MKDTGKHLQATEDYLQQHSLLETQLKALSKRVRNLNRRSKQIEPTHQEGGVLEKRLEDLNKDLDRYLVILDYFVIEENDRIYFRWINSSS